MTIYIGWLLPFLVSLLFMLLEYRSCGDFFGPVPIATRLLRVFLDVFILSLFLGSNSTHVLLFRHRMDAPFILRRSPLRPSRHPLSKRMHILYHLSSRQSSQIALAAIKRMLGHLNAKPDCKCSYNPHDRGHDDAKLEIVQRRDLHPTPAEQEQPENGCQRANSGEVRP